MSDFDTDDLVFASKPDNKRRSSLAFPLSQPHLRRKSAAQISKILQQFYRKEERDASDLEIPYDFDKMNIAEMSNILATLQTEVSDLEETYADRVAAATENDLASLLKWLQEKKESAVSELPQKSFDNDAAEEESTCRMLSERISTSVDGIMKKMSRIREQLDALKLLESIPN